MKYLNFLSHAIQTQCAKDNTLHFSQRRLPEFPLPFIWRGFPLRPSTGASQLQIKTTQELLKAKKWNIL